MIPIKSIDEIRKIQLNILDYVHYLCEKYNLRYYLAGGTLLGAIRHKGYIPWDDDIDILMPRPDYEKLIYIINHNTNKRFRFITYWNEKNYMFPFGKIVRRDTKLYYENEINCENMGMFIDVFPMDGIKGNTKIYATIAHILQGMRSKRKLNLFDLISGKLLCYVSETLAKRDVFESEKLIACKVNGFGNREIIEYKYFEKSFLVEFEDRKYYAPIGYDVYLKNLYKNYMKLPPKNQQRRNHMFRVWYK